MSSSSDAPTPDARRSSPPDAPASDSLETELGALEAMMSGEAKPTPEDPENGPNDPENGSDEPTPGLSAEPD